MKFLLETLRNKKRGGHLPIWFMRQAGRHLPEYLEIRRRYENFMDFIKSPQDVADVTLQPLKRYDIDAVILFSDILVIPDSLGQKIWFEEKKGPVLNPIRSGDDFKKLKSNHSLKGKEAAIKAISLVKQQLPNHVALIGFVGAPWTLLTYMIEGGSSKDFSQTKNLYYRDHALFSDLFSLVEGACQEYLSAQIEAGAEVIQLFDSWAGAVPYTLFEELVVQPNKRLCAWVQKKGVPVIAFPRGIGGKVSSFVQECRPDALNLDSTVTPLILEQAVVQGGIDPAVLVAGGDALKQQAQRYLDFYKDSPYVLNLGHGVLPETPISHVKELIKFAREYTHFR